MRLLSWVAVRVAVCAATLTVLSVLVFSATEVLPGDAAGVASGPAATPAERAAVRVSLGLDRPPLERYLDWAQGAAHGDLGTSMTSGTSVTAVVGARAANSLAVVLPAALMILVIAGTAGTWAGLHAGSRADRVISASGLALAAAPDFLIATALLLGFTLWWPVLPAVAIVPIGQSLWQRPELVALPALALALGGCGATLRLLRASVAQTAAEPYAGFARLNGYRGPRYARSIVANAAGPAVQAFSIMLAGLVGGAVVVETLFNVPGLGQELTRAVAARDVPLVQGLSLVLGAVALLVLLAGDVTARLLTAPTRRNGGSR
ncbi:ABC transporter permease [Kineosporia sp. J2-2]|uniref:ABC transporter permease n=1 Tax=Kineosporia corallincola TaxID=2835133 RepID=A0ABS5TTE1_9ACTN|nr:ABC transporter permease [Kineosporia corallincola]MBT0774009.1 ABC transporter permease [Kineosporia corallincola]